MRRSFVKVVAMLPVAGEFISMEWLGRDRWGIYLGRPSGG